jgi:hypothetical protein
MTLPAPYEKSKFLGSGGSMVARLKLKGIDGRAPPGVNIILSSSALESARKGAASQLCSLLVRADAWRHYRIAGKSLEPSLPSWGGNTPSGQGNDLGYGKNVKDWAIRSQAPKGGDTYGEGSETKW